MKRIIAFVLLGLLIYAGGFVIYYALVDLGIRHSVPNDLERLQPYSMYTGLVAEGDVYQVVDKLYTEVHRAKLLGIPVGKAITQHYYILPVGTSGMFMLIAASDENDIEALEKMKTDTPRERGKNDPALEVYGIMEETSPIPKSWMRDYFIYKQPELIGYSWDDPYRFTYVADKHIVPFTLYIKHPGDVDYTPLIVGIAMCVVGTGLTVLLILRIKSEREGY